MQCNLAVQNVFYILLCMESAFAYNLESTEKMLNLTKFIFILAKAFIRSVVGWWRDIIVLPGRPSYFVTQGPIL